MTQGLAHGGWGTAGATNDSVCGGRGSRDRKGGKVQAEPFQPAPCVGGAPTACTPQSVLGPLHRRGEKAAPLSLTAGSGVSGSPWFLLEMASGEAPTRGGGGGPEKWDFSSQDPRQGGGALFPVSTPKRDGGGLGVGPCHPGLFSGPELGIKIDWRWSWRKELGWEGTENPH